MAAQSMRQSGQQFLHSVRFKLTIAVTIVLTLILGLWPLGATSAIALWIWKKRRRKPKLLMA